MFSSTFTLLTLLAASAAAQMVPTSPDGSTVARIGSELTTLWEKDASGVWDDVTIQLMSGDNFNMIPVTTLTTGIDATSLTSYTFTVPSVSPTSAIYFLQFTPGTGNISDVTWTTRFTIAAADGSTTPPANSVQPNGASIPWGVGSLTNGASSGGAPADSGNGTTTMATGSMGGNGATTAVVTPIASAQASASGSATASASASESETEEESMTNSVSPTALAASNSNSATTTRATAAAASSTGAAVGLKVGGGALVGMVMGVLMML